VKMDRSKKNITTYRLYRDDSERSHTSNVNDREVQKVQPEDGDKKVDEHD